jgi:methylmalonyl-CoA mutase C-terminal domain/subunit
MSVRQGRATGGSAGGSERVRVLMAKPGLDGHDRGAKLVARILRDEGFEVIYLGLHQTTEAIAMAAVQEDVDIVGLSVLSGAHLPHTGDLRRQLDELGCEDILIVVGGIIPPEDEPRLIAAGAAAVFPVGTNVLEIPDRLRDVFSREVTS